MYANLKNNLSASLKYIYVSTLIVERLIKFAKMFTKCYFKHVISVGKQNFMNPMKNASCKKYIQPSHRSRPIHFIIDLLP